MTPDLEPLSADSLAVLAEAEVPKPPAEVEQRLLSRLRAELPEPTVQTPAKLGTLGAPMAGAGLAIGLALGAFLHARLAEPVIVTEVRTVEVPAPPVTVAPVAPVVPTPKPAAAARPRKDDVPALDHALAEERTLIERARSALVRGEPRLAIDALAKHRHSFPRGRLAEERESLYVQALMKSGDFEAARARARDFATNFPNSLLAPAVEAAVQSIPR